jgi:hypothetical protein
MAKSKSAKKKRRYPPVMITVKSKTYGTHERAARGSWKKAKLNDAMKGHSERMIGSNAPAKLILDALAPFRTNFKGGQLWQKLLKHFALQAKQFKDYSVLGIAHWDLNLHEPTSRIMAPTVKIEADKNSSILNVTVSYFFGDRFKQRKGNITHFRITIILMFPDFTNNEITTIPVVLPDKLLSDEIPYSFIVQIPPGATSYLPCFKAEACVNGELTKNSRHVDKVMCLEEAGVL